MRRKQTRERNRRERGQSLVLFALGLTVLLGFVALTVDVGLAFVERRSLQNAVDAAALAAAEDMLGGENQSTAEATVVDYMNRHGYSAPDATIQMNIPPLNGKYAGMDGYVEVTASTEASRAFLVLFREDPFTVTVRAVAEWPPDSVGSGGGDGGGEPPLDPLPVTLPTNVECGSPTADGRVTDSDGYTWIGSLVGGTTLYGDAYFACDSSYYYLALRLNGPDAASVGGGVANENVYGGCKPGEVQIDGDQVKKLKGAVSTVGGSSFTVDIDGTLWTVDVDGDTDFRGDLNGIEDLTPGQGVEVKGDLVGPEHALAAEVKDNNKTYCTPEVNANYNVDYNTGWDKHDFNALLKSDRARFQLACDDVVRHDFVQDYLIDDGAGGWYSGAAGDGEVIVAGPAAAASSLEWNLEHPYETGWGDDPGEDPLVQSPPFSSQYPYYSPDYDGWEWDMTYEFAVSKSDYDSCSGPVLFGLYNFAGQSGPLEGIHSSPAKTAEGVFLQILPGTVQLVE